MLKKENKANKIITGIYSQNKNGDFGFIDVKEEKKGYFVFPKNLNGALDGDEVEAYVKLFNKREEAVITKIIKRADRVLVGEIQINKNFGFVILNNKSFKNDIFIPSKNLYHFKNIKNKDIVAIKIVDWKGKNPTGKIVEILGNKNSEGINEASMILEAGLSIDFPEKVLNEAKNLKYEENKGRINLEKIFTFTIDGEDARDLDDAISIEKVGENYKLIVSIADVGEYVKEKTFLDKEAYKRGNSTYLPDKVIPMLPEKLSNDLCSLNPNTKKLTLSCEIIIDKNGKIISKKVYEAIIKSDFRLTYKDVQEILDGKLNIGDKLKFSGIITEELIKKVNLTYELKKIIEAKKQKNGVLNFDFPETKIILDEKKNPIEIKKYERFESHKIIEEFMILANESVGELFSRTPFLYRIHPIPNEDDIEKLRQTLALFNITLPYKNITPKLISNILEEINKSPKTKLLSKMLLRSLEKAIYSDVNEGHFGLGLDFYSHFTSPIRRYPDLVIHRIIKEKIRGKLNQDRIKHYKEILPKIGKHTSETEVKSEKLEYQVKDLYICKYYEDKIGVEEKGIISGIIPAGIFLELENGAEGFLPLENILETKNTKKVILEEEYLRFNFGNNTYLQIGDEVKIKLTKIDKERNRLIFSLI